MYCEQFPSLPLEVVMGEQAAFKDDRIENADFYTTIYGEGSITDGQLNYGKSHIGKYDFYIIGDEMRVIFYYSGKPDHKEWNNGFTHSSVWKKPMNIDEFENTLNEKKDDCYFTKCFKSKARQIISRYKS